MLPSFNVPKSTLLKPEFTSKEFSYIAGSSFVVNFNDNLYLLTAHHLFGPPAGLDKKYSKHEITQLSPSVKAYDFDNGSVVVESNQFLPIKNAKELNWRDASPDIAIFKIPNAKIESLTLASSTPVKGDIVFLYAHLKNASKNDTRYHSATITASNGKFIKYRYHNRFLNPTATSGAPVLNQSGEVVGLNVSVAGFPILNWKGVANPLISISQALNACNPTQSA